MLYVILVFAPLLGAITLTLRDRGDVRRQDIGEQVHRDRATAVGLKKVRSRAGI